MISSPFSSSKRMTDILFLFVGRCYVLKELDSGIVNLLHLGIIGPLVASSLCSDNYSSRPPIPKQSRFTIPESNYSIYIYIYIQKNAWHPPEGKCHVLRRRRRMLWYHVARPLI